MKKNRSKRLMITVLFCLLLGMLNTNIVMAAPSGWITPAGYTAITDAPGINQVNFLGSNKEIPGEYASMFKLAENTSYESSGEASIYVDPNSNDPSNPSKLFLFDPADSSKDQYVLVRNAGLFNGKMVDLKVTLDSYDIKPISGSTNYPYVAINGLAFADSQRIETTGVWASSLKYNKSFLAIGGSTGSGFKTRENRYQKGDGFSYSYEILDHDTSNPITDYKGVWNFLNINNIKTATTIPKAIGDFEDFYIYDPTTVTSLTTGDNSLMGYKYSTGNDQVIFTGSGSKVGTDTTRITQLIDSYKIKTSMQRSDVGSTLSAMAITFSTQSIARIAPATPIVKAQVNDATHADADYKKIKYSILQTIPDNDVNNRDDVLKINTEVPTTYQIDRSDIEVYEYGTDNNLTANFTIAANSDDPTNLSKATLTAKNPKDDSFVGKIYEIRVKASWKSSTTLADVKEEYKKIDNDSGYLEYEIGKKTNTFYSYQYTVNGGGTLSDTLTSKEDETTAKTTLAKVLYEAIPDGKAKTDVTADPETLIKSVYPDPKELLKELSLDIAIVPAGDSSGVTVTYDDDTVKTGTEDSITNVTLVLTTTKGVTSKVKVAIKAVQPLGEYEVNFVDEGNDPIRDSVTLTLDKGSTVDLTKETAVANVVSAIKTEGYERDTWDNPYPETAYEINDSDGTITYKFKGTLTFKEVPDTISFEQGKVNPTIEQNLRYTGTDEFILSVKDLRSLNGDENKQRGQFKINAKLTTPFTSSDASELTNADLIYNPTGSDEDAITISSDYSTIYTNEKETDKSRKQFDVQLDSGSSSTVANQGLRLKLNKGNNAEAKTYTAKITWDLVSGP